MALFESNIQINEIVDHIFILLDFKSLSNLEQINTNWSRYLRDPRLWLRLCIKKESKWFKHQSDPSNQNFVQYKNANLQWHQLFKTLDEEENYGLRRNVLKYLKLRFKNAPVYKPLYTNTAPFSFAARYGDLALAKHIAFKIDPFKNMKRSAIIDVEVGEVLDDEIVPFDPTLIPIHTATRYGHLEVVKFLMETYSHLNELTDEFNMTPIEIAVDTSNMKIVKNLLHFTMREDIKIRAFDLAIGKRSYRFAFKISKWHALVALKNWLFFHTIFLQPTGWRLFDTLLNVFMILCIITIV